MPLSNPSAWQPSLAPALLTTTPKGTARLSHARCKAVPRLPRSTGEGPVCSPLFRRLLEAVQQELAPVDPSQPLVLLGQPRPGVAEGVVPRPELQPALHGLVGGEAHGGNAKLTAQQTGVPRATLQRWASGEGVHSCVPDIGHQKREDLADRLEDLAHRLMDAVPGKVAQADLKGLGVCLGIAVDKMRLRREQPTSIEGHDLSDEQRHARLRELAERAQARSLGLPDPGRATGVGQPQPTAGTGGLR